MRYIFIIIGVIILLLPGGYLYMDYRFIAEQERYYKAMGTADFEESASLIRWIMTSAPIE
ncbi:hypothetical protein AB9P05_24675 [Roseivirga sp. BDSF3-8]|uniref:hypothetical protein n=1 Tax=Roseivirga sp. BDSF3-8 TaxID=3241598 RepID=UPI0035318289